MTQIDGIFIGNGGEPDSPQQVLLFGQANRHGLVAGATGTGKTVTLQVLAEGFSAAGVPVFLADVKGDLAGLSQAGSAAGPLHDKLVARAEKIGLTDFSYAASPVTFWDLAGEKGHPIRATVTEMGPLLLSRLLDLSEAQEGILNIVFRVADDEGLLLLDLKDLQALLVRVGETAQDLSLRYGNIQVASVGAIQRRLLVLETEGGAGFFGEPALQLTDLMLRGPDGRGRINILAADRLMMAPRLYATFLLWLLSELFEELPEIGDPAKPVLVFFFDEAHLLFSDAPKALVDKVEQVARLIRSKGVGVYFISQNPLDIPDDVLGQLGNRVQHALRAYTPRDQKAVKAAAETFRANPAFDTETAILEVGTGEAVVSMLGPKGVPGMVERVLVRPPASRLGPVTAAERAAVMAASPVAGVYDRMVDRVSAFEVLRDRAEAAATDADTRLAAPEAAAPEARQYRAARVWGAGRGEEDAPRSPKPAPRARSEAPSRSRSDSLGETLAKTVVRAAGTQVTRALVRGVLGSLFRGR